MTNNDEPTLKLEQIEWLHGAAEEAAAVNLKMTMKPEEILQITSMLLALLAERDADKKRIAELEAEKLSQAAVDVLSERRRQVTAEGWTPEHDDEHADGSMADAAGCYALHAHDTAKDMAKNFVPAWWPWDPEWFKRSSPRRDLVKAGALILAEIERLDRAAGIKLEVGE